MLPVHLLLLVLLLLMQRQSELLQLSGLLLSSLLWM